MKRRVVGAAGANGVGRSGRTGVVEGLDGEPDPRSSKWKDMMKGLGQMGLVLHCPFPVCRVSLAFSLSSGPTLNSKKYTWGNLVGEIKEYGGICLQYARH